MGCAGTQDVPPGLHRHWEMTSTKAKPSWFKALLNVRVSALGWAVTAADQGGPGRHGNLAGIQRHLEVPVGGGLGPGPHLGAGGDLPAGHGVDLIVDHDDSDCDVPAGGVEQMVSADGHAIPVPGKDDDPAGRPGGLQPDGCGDGAAVEDLEDVGMDINGNPGA